MTFKRKLAGIFGGAAVLFSTLTAPAFATTYGTGTYGACNYNTGTGCSISVSTDGPVSLSVTPDSIGRCTVRSNVVTVTTGNPTGYTLTLENLSSDSWLSGSGGAIGSTGATSASPQPLPTNTWGYRVDGAGGFGGGPTAASTSVPVPLSQTYARVPNSTQPPDVIAASPASASSGAATSVWYGVCANAGVRSGSYSATLLYTAVAN